MKYAPFLLLLSCGGVKESEVGWQPLSGIEYMTPERGISFWWVGPGGSYATPEEAATAIDAAYTEWVSIDVARFGGNLSVQARLSAIQRVDIQLFQGNSVPGTISGAHTLAIWWPWQHQIDASMAAPYHWDAGLEVWSAGLQCLRHEWSHVLHGAYHP